MNDFSDAIALLQEGQVVSVRVRGMAMKPIIVHDQVCIVDPVTDTGTLQVNDIVLCRHGRADYLHFIAEINGNKFLIANNAGSKKGWVDGSMIFGKYRVPA